MLSKCSSLVLYLSTIKARYHLYSILEQFFSHWISQVYHPLVSAECSGMPVRSGCWQMTTHSCILFFFSQREKLCPKSHTLFSVNHCPKFDMMSVCTGTDSLNWRKDISEAPFQFQDPIKKHWRSISLQNFIPLRSTYLLAFTTGFWPSRHSQISGIHLYSCANISWGMRSTFKGGVS